MFVNQEWQTYSSSIFPVTEKILSNVNFYKGEFLPVTRRVDPSKAHGHDQISIQKMKLIERNSKSLSQK